MSGKKLGTEIRKEQIARASLTLIGSLGWERLNIASIAHRVGIVP